MPRDPVTRIVSKSVVMPTENIDTDQIIPARFLTTTTRDGLGVHLFNDWRYEADGTPKADFVLNRPEMARRTILVGGDNFGCGSSREHAPWALADFGFRAVLSTEIADIFRSNAQKNGIVPVEITPAFYRHLLDHPDSAVTVDLDALQVCADGIEPQAFEIEPFARHCLMTGVDQLGFLESHAEAIARFEEARA